MRCSGAIWAVAVHQSLCARKFDGNVHTHESPFNSKSDKKQVQEENLKLSASATAIDTFRQDGVSCEFLQCDNRYRSHWQHSRCREKSCCSNAKTTLDTFANAKGLRRRGSLPPYRDAPTRRARAGFAGAAARPSRHRVAAGLWLPPAPRTPQPPATPPRAAAGNGHTVLRSATAGGAACAARADCTALRRLLRRGCMPR